MIGCRSSNKKRDLSGAIDLGAMSRRRFIRFGVGSAIVAAVGLLTGYFLMRRPEASSSGTVRLPPGQSEVAALQVLHIDGVPDIDPEKWAFEVDGEVENPIKLSWNEFLQLPKTTDVSDFDCVTGWTKLDNRWEGVRFEDIAKLARPTARAKYATIECYGDIVYTTSLPLEDLLRDDVLFAYGLDGKRLEPVHGGPVRLVVPQKYAYKSAKWVKRVRFTETQELGFWESSGYSNTADPWTNDRYA
jgi:DMSO/TMAO reductase YedYZ molybdopterin-dependent catalytic subunit